MRWATLPEYAAWVLAQPLNLLRGIPHETYHLGDIVAFVMHREPPFQTELVHLLPRGRESGNEVGEHVHPHVEGLEYIIYGELYFTLAGKPLCDPRLVKKFARGAGKWRFEIPPIHVPAGMPHGATVGPGGGAFLSIQQWHEGAPPMSTVGLDWEGAPMDDKHAQRLRGEP